MLTSIALSFISTSFAFAGDSVPRPYQGPPFFMGIGYVSTRFLVATAPLGDGSPIYAATRPGGGKVVAVLDSETGPGVKAVQVVPNQDIVVLVIVPMHTGLIGWKGWVKFTVITEGLPDGQEVAQAIPAVITKIEP